MTNREMYEAIINGNEITSEMKEKAQALIDALDKSNSARRVAADKKRAEKEAERAPQREALFALLTSEGKTATQLIEESGLEIKPQSVVHIFKPLIEEGKVEKVDVKVTGKGVQRGYVLA